MRHLLIGTALVVEDRAVALSQSAFETVSKLSPYASWMIDTPLIAPARRRVQSAIDSLIERGRAEEALGREEAALLLDGVIERAVTSAKIDGIVADVVGRVLDPVLEEALPLVIGRLRDDPEKLIPLVNSIVGEALDPILEEALPKVLGNIEGQPEMMVPLVRALVGEALDPILQEALPKVLGNIESQPEMMVPLVRALVGEALEPVLHEALPQVIEILNEDPEAIRSLVRDQSTGMAADMAHTVRTRAADADDRVDRAIRRIMRRKVLPPELTPGSQAALPPGAERSTTEGQTEGEDGPEPPRAQPGPGPGQVDPRPGSDLA